MSSVSLNILLVFSNMLLSNKRQSLDDIIVQEVTSFWWDNGSTNISKFLGFDEITVVCFVINSWFLNIKSSGKIAELGVML